MNKIISLIVIIVILCGCNNGAKFEYVDEENNNNIEKEEEIVDNSKNNTYRIRITSKIDTLNIRSSTSTIDKSNIVGTTTCGIVYDVYEDKIADGYTWHRIGVNQWIADDGTWTEKVPDDYIEEEIVFNSTRVGDTIYFGNYEQDNNTSNGKEKVEWIILDNTGNKILLISKYALDSCIYNNTYTTWADSKIRDFLNNTFYDSIFTDQEKCYVEKTKNTSDVPNDKQSSDYIFLLSSSEIEKYWPTQEDRISYGTQYAFAKGAENFSNKCRWWLRTVNQDEQQALTIRTSEGRINYVTPMNSTGYAVRPAVWIKLK